MHGRYYQFKKGDVTQIRRAFEEQADALSVFGGERLVCASCAVFIASPDAQMSVIGKTEHVFTNPAGLRFHVVCFRQVENCHVTGKPCVEDTWFPGFAWRVLYCRSCNMHLGWQYSGDKVFYGLIAQRLRSQSGH